MMYALKYVGILRVSNAGELEGLDLHEHGATAYPEYALAGDVVSTLLGGDHDHHNGHTGAPLPASVDGD
jgi:Amt family ammonium transporter